MPFELCGIHHIPEFRFIHGCCHHHVGQCAHVGHVKDPVVGGSVFAHEASPVETENDVEVLQGDVMDHLVVSPLHKGGIDVAEGNHPLRGQSGGKSHRMLL